MAPVDPGTMYLIMVSIIVVAIILISVFCKDDGKEKGRGAARQRQMGRAADQADAPPGGVRRRGPRRRMQRNRDDSDEDDLPDEETEDYLDQMLAENEGKIGAKKMRKLQEKAERKAQRLAEEQEREEKKQREKLREEQRKKEEEREKAEAAEREKEEKLRKEEEEKREHEEYLKLKEAFTVEESGEADAEADLTSQSLLQEFIDYIKNMKVVMLEDLAAQFKIKTQDAIQRVQELVEEGRLTGVIDDRGKFIYITMEELQAVSKYIKQHGRVSISELAKSSNRLISLNPDTAALEKQIVDISG